MTREELQGRLKQFVLRSFKLLESLPKSTAATVIGGQLARSSSSSAANYRAACRARSGAEFTSRIGVVLEEMDESAFWLELVIDAGVLPAGRVAPLLEEAKELTAIFARSFSTARRSRDAQSNSSQKSSSQKS